MHTTGSHAVAVEAARQTCISRVMRRGVVSGDRAETLYLGLHEFRMALVGLRMLELVLPVVRVQQAAGL